MKLGTDVQHYCAVSGCFFTARCYAQRGIAMVSRPSVCLFVTWRYYYIVLVSSKILTYAGVFALGSS